MALTTSRGFSEGREALMKSLSEVIPALKLGLGAPWKYRMVSQAQASAVEREYYVWTQSNSQGVSPVFDVGSHRAAIYNQTAAARQLAAFIRVAKISTAQLCAEAIRGLEAGSLMVSFMMLRSLIERTAHIAALADAVRGLSQTPQSTPNPNLPVLMHGDRIGKALYGTKIDWQSLREVDIRSAKKEDVAYTQKELTMDVGAASVLSSVDKLAKSVAGLRIAYDVLCEFLHPNVGDLYAATIRGASAVDPYGTRHVTRELGMGPADLSNAPDLDAVLTKVLAVCSEAIRALPTAIKELEAASADATRRAKKFAHMARKKNRSLFRSRDLCPCLSGLPVRDCR
jgi:hypothetical protein